jgi:L-rhamnose mutarotase
MVLLVVMIAVLTSCSKREGAEQQAAKSKVKRVGMVVGIKPEAIPEYKRLHADSNPGVRDLLNKYHMHNFTIYLQEIDGKWYEFGYYEYTGDDFEGDMAKLDAEPRNKEWLKICDPMQIPLKGATGWTVMEEVYRND